MVLTAIGYIHIWDIKSLTALHEPLHIAPILDAASMPGDKLTQGPSIIFARLNSRGAVIVAMSNGEGWTYSLDMKAWLRLSEPWWAVGSQYWSTTDSSVNVLGSSAVSKTSKEREDRDDEVSMENLSAGIVPLLERNTTMHALVRGRAFFLQRLMKALLVAEGFEGFEANVSIAHLENRVAAAMELGAREEFKVYLLMYAKRLGAEGLKGKIEELLRTLLGKLFVADDDDTEQQDRDVTRPRRNGSSWFDEGDAICGWPRKELLKEVLFVLGKSGKIILSIWRGRLIVGIIGKYRDLQRSILPYSRILGLFEQREPQDAEDGVMAEG
jgi:protein HIRA/HIR1